MSLYKSSDRDADPTKETIRLGALDELIKEALEEPIDPALAEAVQPLVDERLRGTVKEHEILTDEDNENEQPAGAD